uniref:WW domain-containing protein n=1 Tax=Timema cristinae TaxID=61476 RepID=A0A7R9DBF3_TIMCR|nr:unnamed protein product [Timema cristinae]
MKPVGIEHQSLVSQSDTTSMKLVRIEHQSLVSQSDTTSMKLVRIEHQSIVSQSDTTSMKPVRIKHQSLVSQSDTTSMKLVRIEHQSLVSQSDTTSMNLVRIEHQSNVSQSDTTSIKSLRINTSRLEVKQYAWKIGINPDTERHLLHYAKEGLMQALPPGWKPCFDEELQLWYYFNFKTGESRWEHPLDDTYRSIVKKVRSESISSAGEEDSKTSAKEDLKSYEEAVEPTTEPASKTMDIIRPGSSKKNTISQLVPLKKSPLMEPVMSPLTTGILKKQSTITSPTTNIPMEESSLRSNSTRTGAIRKEFGKNPPSGFGPRVDLGGGGLSRSEPMVKKEIPSPTARIDIDKMDMTSLVRQDSSSSRREKLLSSQEKHPRSMTGKGELTLTGWYIAAWGIESAGKLMSWIPCSLQT